MFKPDRDTSDQRVAERIRVLMKRRDVTIRELSEKSGLPYRTVQNYLTGKVSLPIAFIVKCCDVLCIEADLLLFGGLDLDSISLKGALEDVLGEEVTSLLHIDQNRKVTVRSIGEEVHSPGDAARSLRGTILIFLAEYVREKYLDIRTEQAWLGKGSISPGDADNERLARAGLFPRD
ncbi:helix-turn-helix domain-containing protein [Rhodoplanes azumiensis]|uniref:Helix-turn-helix domain-containing protein n=1 Tax=Rhodoplanes azumiensis TaxID=1897628 RepID=A0ABW5AN30_9BRAD